MPLQQLLHASLLGRMTVAALSSLAAAFVTLRSCCLQHAMISWIAWPWRLAWQIIAYLWAALLGAVLWCAADFLGWRVALAAMPDMRGKVAIVTGASQGIGFECAKASAMIFCLMEG